MKLSNSYLQIRSIVHAKSGNGEHRYHMAQRNTPILFKISHSSKTIAIVLQECINSSSKAPRLIEPKMIISQLIVSESNTYYTPKSQSHTRKFEILANSCPKVTRTRCSTKCFKDKFKKIEISNTPTL